MSGCLSRSPNENRDHIYSKKTKEHTSIKANIDSTSIIHSTTTTNPSSLSSSKLNSPTLLSRQTSSSALTSSISIPGQTSTFQVLTNNQDHTHSKKTNSNPKHRSNSSNELRNNVIPSAEDKSNEVLKLVIICVGLPARGKSYITKKLQRYLNWMQYNTQIFNVGNTRRQENAKPSDYPVQGPTIDHNNNAHIPPSSSETITDNTPHDANFFDPYNAENFHKREQWARETLDRMVDFLMLDTGNVSIFDATNTTKARRSWIVETVNQRTNGTVKILFLESICTDQELIEKNIRLKLSGPDYKNMDRQVALEDFRNRLKNYEKVYETIDDQEEKENEKYDIQYVKIVNAGKKVISYNISGYLSSQCVFFLLNFNLADRQIWLTMNGESEFNAQHRKGGDSNLTKKGERFAQALPKFIGKKRQEFKLSQLDKQYVNDESCFHCKPGLDPDFNIWTSNLKRTMQTAAFFPEQDDQPSDGYHLKSFRMLNDLGCGSIDSLYEEDFRTSYPEQYQDQLTNRLGFRFPGLGGESYLDVIARLRPMIIELERLKDHVLIVSHRVIIRVLLCYFMNLNKEMLTELEVQHGILYCIEPKPYGLDLKIWQYDEVTDDFYEVDEIEIMKKKRKRLSISIGSNYRPILRKFDSQSSTVSSSSDYSDSEDDVEQDKRGDSSMETSPRKQQASTIDSPRRTAALNEISKSLFIQRSDSQCYEFATSNSSTDLSAVNTNVTPPSLLTAECPSCGGSRSVSSSGFYFSKNNSAIHDDDSDDNDRTTSTNTSNVNNSTSDITPTTNNINNNENLTTGLLNFKEAKSCGSSTSLQDRANEILKNEELAKILAEMLLEKK